MIEQLQNKGLKIIYAKSKGFNPPDKLQGAEPDVICWESEKQLLHVGLVADSKTISSDPFKEKFEVLTKLSMASGNSKGEHVPFYLGVTEDAGNSKNKDFTEKLSPQDNIIKISK